MPDYVVILAWVHTEAIIKDNQEYVDRGGRFVTIFPNFKIIGNK